MANEASTFRVADGFTDEFSIPFDFQNDDDLIVTVDKVPAIFELIDRNTVRITPRPSIGSIVRIRRETSREARVDFFRDEPVTQRELAVAQQQLLFLVQEVVDLTRGTLRVNDEGVFDAEGIRITNVGQPVFGPDVITIDALGAPLGEKGEAFSDGQFFTDGFGWVPIST